MTTQAANQGVENRLRSKLAGFRRAVAMWIALDGAAAICLAVAGFVAVSLLLDWTFRLDLAQRILVLGLIVVGLGVLAWRRLARPMLARLGDDALCRLVENHHHAELDDGLITAVQLSRLGDPESRGYSVSLVRAAVDEGTRRAAAVDFADSLDRRTMRRNLAAAGGALVVLAVAAALLPGTMGLWFERNVMLSATAAWPQKTHLEVLGVTDGEIVCPRGDDLTVEVQVRDVVPTEVTIDYRQADGTSGREPMSRTGEGLFSTEFRNILQPLELRVYGGDAETDWVRVRLVERPVVENIDLAVTPPEYLRAAGEPATEPKPLSSKVGRHGVLKGSTLHLEGSASKHLDSVTLTFAGKQVGAIERAGERGFKAALSGETLKTGTYSVDVVDTTGLASRRPARFTVRIVPDAKPKVRAELEGIGDLVIPRAVVPVRGRIEDDHEVVTADLAYAAAGEGEELPEPRRDLFGGDEDRYGVEKIETVHRLEVSKVTPEPGMQLVLFVEARDNDTVSGPKTGKSGTFSLKIVTEDELRAELLRREQEQRMELMRLLRDQENLLRDTRTMLAVLGRNEDLSDADRTALKAAERRQRLVGGRCMGIADQMARILAEVLNNRLEADPDDPQDHQAAEAVRKRLRGRIIDPLDLAARRTVIEAADNLDVARKLLAGGNDRPAEVGARLEDAATSQQAIVATLKDVLAGMVKWEGYQEAVTLLRDVLRSQKEVGDETEREYKRKIREIFGD